MGGPLKPLFWLEWGSSAVGQSLPFRVRCSKTIEILGLFGLLESDMARSAYFQNTNSDCLNSSRWPNGHLHDPGVPARENVHGS